MVRFFGTLVSLVCIVATATAETLLTDAKIAKIDDRGMVLQVGSQPLAVEDNYQTRFWLNKASAKRESFHAGDAVFVRIKTDVDPPQLREMADRATWTWLDSIRKGAKRGTIEKRDPKSLTIKFDDGSTFAYRCTDKTVVQLKSKPGAVLSDLEAGMMVYAKGRLLPSLDTFLSEVSDSLIESKSEAGMKSKKVKMTPLPTEGSIEGRIVQVNGELSMIDVQSDRLLHVTFTSSTKFTLDGQTVTKAELRIQMNARVAYRRDKAGRIIASSVGLLSKL